jgi:hypothetical protein
MNKKVLWSVMTVMLALSMLLAACGGAATQAPVATEAPAAEAPVAEAPVAEAPAGEECGTGAPIIPGGDPRKSLQRRIQGHHGHHGWPVQQQRPGQV